MPLSYSQLQTYRTCPRQFEYGYVKKIPRGVSAGESFGGSVHNALKRWGELEIGDRGSGIRNQIPLFPESNKAESVPLELETLQRFWSEAFSAHGYESREATDEAYQKGFLLMEYFYNWWGECERKVVTIESGFAIDCNGERVTGRFDRVEEDAEGLHVIDFKTSAVRDQESVDADLQLSIYALAAQQMFGRPCARLTLLHLRSDGVFPVETVRSAEQLAEAKELIAKTGQSIVKSEFIATPSESVCGRCPYRRICDKAMI